MRREPPDRLDRAARRQPGLPAEHSVQVPGNRLGKRKQPQRFRGRPAVDDHGVPPARLGQPLHLGQCEQLIHAGQDGQFLGFERVEPGAGHGRPEFAAQVLPDLVDEPARVHLGAVQAAIHLHRFGGQAAGEGVAE